MRSTERFQPLNLILDAVCDTSLQDTGDVGIQLAVLLPQRGNRHHHRRLNLVEVHQDVTQLGIYRPSPGSSGGIRGHTRKYTSFLYDKSTHK
jgi:hypothetical protein